MKTFWMIFCLPVLVFAAYLKDVPVEMTQPDGSILYCFASGDEYYSRLHDADGYTIVQSDEDGFYYYAQKNNDQINPSIHRADQNHDFSQLGINPNIVISKSAYQDIRERWWNGVERRDAPTIGTVNNLNVFIRFADEEEFGNSRAYYDGPFNDENGPSMKDYFHEVSYGLLTVNTTHYPESEPESNLSYQDEYPRSYYQPYNQVTNPSGYANDSERTNREHTLLMNAISFIESEVPDSLNIDADDDGNVDNVTFLVYGQPGGWADLLWPHRWALYSVASYINDKRVWDYNFNMASGPYFSVGTLCHEFCHSLGAPDLYHYWDDAAPVAVGGWDVMDASADIPQYPSSYIKYRYFDWIELEEASGGGTFTLNPVTMQDTSAYRLNSSNPNEYFVIEYRTQEGIYDTNAPGIDKGIVIYRVNDLYNGQGNANGPPDELYVYRVGGTSNTSGTFGSAIFSQEVGRTQFNDTTDPSSFLSDGSIGGINITDISSADETIEFTVLNLMLYGNYFGFSNDSDGDDILNPGETAILEFNMSNISDDILAYAVTGTLSSDYPVTFPNPVIEFGDINGGQSSYSFFSEIILDEDIPLGDIPITLEINAEYIQNNDLLFYNDSYTFNINVSLNQSGFPYETSFPISSSAILLDVNNDGQKEILFGDFDGKIRAFESNGDQVENDLYPFTTNDQIWGSIASADMDLDGVIDFVVSSTDKHLYFFDQNGYNGNYFTESFLTGTPVIGNIDDDPEMEVLIGGYSSGDGRMIFALNHDRTDVDGFPIYIGEKIKMGLSLADFNNNGKDDIVFGTDSDNIYLIYDDGSVADGFPFEADGKFRSSPSILDVDGELIILAGNNDNHLYGINSDGSLRFSFSTEHDVETSPSFLNHMNNCYIFFGDKDGYLYAVDYNGNLYPNYPIDIGSQISKSIIFSDLDSDLNPEIIFGTEDGNLHIMHLNGFTYDSTPISYPFSYHSAPIIYDIDNDNDYEIIAGTSLSINVLDIKEEGGMNNYWPMYKGNYKRNGFNQFTPLCQTGDLNEDGVVDILDILQTINIILNLNEPSMIQVCASDLNVDATIDLLDIILLVQIVLDA